jgi:DNA-binding protein H-NS
MERKMNTDLKSMSRKELEKLKADVEKALLKASDRDLKAAREAAMKAAAAHGFSLAELTGKAPEKQPRKTAKPAKTLKAKSKPKYRDPADATKTWTGKGRQPDWFKSAIAAGKDPSSMAI